MAKMTWFERTLSIEFSVTLGLLFLKKSGIPEVLTGLRTLDLILEDRSLFILLKFNLP
jgi:hypothetical protein